MPSPKGLLTVAVQIAFVHSRNGLVNVFKRVIQIFENVGLGQDRGRAGFVANVDWRLLFHQRCCKFVVDGRHMFDLLTESADAFELAVRWEQKSNLSSGMASQAGMNSCSKLLTFRSSNCVTVRRSSFGLLVCADTETVSAKNAQKMYPISFYHTGPVI